MMSAPPSYDDVEHHRHPPPPKYDDPPQTGWNPPPEPTSAAPTMTTGPTEPTMPTVPTAAVMMSGSPGPPVGPQPQAMICPSCHAQIVTDLKYTSSSRTHLAALALCFLGGLFCVWIPYIMDSCKNADHYCPNCAAYLGSYK